MNQVPLKTRDILGFGCATIDELITVDFWPEAERKLPIRHRESQGGGLGATALVAAARLGASCAYGGMLGYDETSRHVLEILQNEHIDISLVDFHPDAGAIRSLVFIDSTHHTRNIFFQRPELVGTPPNMPSEEEIASSRCLFIDHYGGIGTVRAIEIARKYGIPVVADFEREDVPNFADFFALTSHPVLSKNFAALLTNETEPEGMIRALWNKNRETVVVTVGEHGSFATQNGISVEYFPTFATQVVDTTGCGDCFHGVYCATLAWGWPLDKRIRWASAAASLKARSIGAQKGLPARTDVEGFLSSI